MSACCCSGGGGGDGGGEWTRAMNVQLMRKIGVNHEGNIECDRFVDYYSNLLPQGPAGKHTPTCMVHCVLL